MLKFVFILILIYNKQRLFKTNWLRIRYRTSRPEGKEYGTVFSAVLLFIHYICSNNTRSAIFRICIYRNSKSFNFKSIIPMKKCSNLLNSFILMSINLSSFQINHFLYLQTQSKNYKLLFSITSQSASIQFLDMSVMLFPLTVPLFEECGSSWPRVKSAWVKLARFKSAWSDLGLAPY